MAPVRMKIGGFVRNPEGHHRSAPLGEVTPCPALDLPLVRQLQNILRRARDPTRPAHHFCLKPHSAHNNNNNNSRRLMPPLHPRRRCHINIRPRRRSRSSVHLRSQAGHQTASMRLPHDRQITMVRGRLHLLPCPSSNLHRARRSHIIPI